MESRRSGAYSIGLVKRCFDVVFASLACLVLSPLLVLVALLIRIGDGGPVMTAATDVPVRPRTPHPARAVPLTAAGCCASSCAAARCRGSCR